MPRARRRRRNPAARKAARAAIPWVPIAAGAGVAAIAYMVLRPRAASAATLPAPLPAPGTTTTPAPTGGGGSGSSSTAALIARLRGSQDARRVFAVQAAMYSVGSSEQVPDGLDGPLTRTAVKTLATSAGIPPPPDDAGSGSNRALAVVANAIPVIFGPTPLYRLLPMALPANVVGDVNRDAGLGYSGFPVLQVRIAPAGSPALAPLPGGRAFAARGPSFPGLAGRGR